ncbi:MAG: CinA family protein [Gammaproteobacteria bacterium]|nr:CinA family protein [Gammaproteobacteria bacterium]
MISISETITKLKLHLIQHHLVLTAVESCTGGLVSSKLTDFEGSSRWFDRGFVTYSNQAKIDLVSVDPKVLEKYGAVSEQVAKQMALGGLINSQSNYSISITGIAGPGGGTEQKPVGMVCFGWAWISKDNQYHSKVSTQLFKGDRQDIRLQSANYSLISLLEIVSLHYPMLK